MSETQIPQELVDEIEHQHRIARYVWDGLRWSMFTGQRTFEEIEAQYAEWFPDYPHPKAAMDM